MLFIIMNNYVTRIVGIIDALESYFDGLRDYLKQTNPEKFIRLENDIEKAADLRTEFSKLGNLANEEAFHAAHLYISLNNLLLQLYRSLDFRLPVGEEISKTRAYRMIEVFNKVTGIYRIYIRDMASALTGFIEQAAKGVTEQDPLRLQAWWRAWPNSIDVYTLKMTELLNSSYREKAHDRITMIMGLLETDKGFILEEKEMLTPFLTFNCVPSGDYGTLSDITNASFKKRYTTVTSFAQDTGMCVIHVTRMNHHNKIHVLPIAVDAAKGITPQDIHATLVDIAYTGGWNWDVVFLNQTDESTDYVIVEQLTDVIFRFLTPWKSPNVVIKKNSLIEKIKSRGFGRPPAYHAVLDNALSKQLSTRVANLVKEEARPVDIGLSILKITDVLLQTVKGNKGTLRERIDDANVDKAFEQAVLDEIHSKVHLKDALLYWCEWTRDDFRKELDVEVSRRSTETLDNEAKLGEVEWHAAQETLHNAVDRILKKNENIFSDLYDKQHKLDVVKMNT